jgi:RNA polymerase sigma-70 factor, ECF subfamily
LSIERHLEADERRRRRFEDLWRAHHDAVMAFVLRRTAREQAGDAVEETFLAAWRRLDEAPDEPRLWLYGIARGVLANERRAGRRRSALLRRLAGLRAVVDPDPADAAFGHGPAWNAFLRLAPVEREAIALVAWDGLEPREAAQVAGCSRTAFRVRLHRARRKLARDLADSAGAALADAPLPVPKETP